MAWILFESCPTGHRNRKARSLSHKETTIYGLPQLIYGLDTFALPIALQDNEIHRMDVRFKIAIIVKRKYNVNGKERLRNYITKEG